MKNITIFILGLLTSLGGFSQHITGHYFDINRLPINSYFSPLDYAPEKCVEISVHNDAFQKGYFINSGGQRQGGWLRIDYVLEKLELRKGPDEPFNQETIKPKKLKSFVIGQDSFFVIYEDPVFRPTGSVKRKENHVVVQELARNDSVIFAYAHLLSPGAPTEPMYKSKVFEKVYFKINGIEKWWELTESDSLFQLRAKRLFGSIDFIQKKLDAGMYLPQNAIDLIHEYRFYQMYLAKKPIHFDPYWNLTDAPHPNGYEGYIDAMDDGIFSFTFFHKQKKYFSVDLDGGSFDQKAGFLTVYDEEGNVHYKTAYRDNKAAFTQTFYPNQNLHHHYQIRQQTSGKEQVNVLKFNKILSPNGATLEQETFTDPVTNREITYVTKGSNLIQAYREVDDRKIYQLLDPEFTFPYKGLQSDFNNFIHARSLDSLDKGKVSGLVLVHVVVGEKGFVEEFSLLNDLHPELSKYLNMYFNSKYVMASDTRGKFRQMKIGKQKVAYETVIPINFYTTQFDPTDIGQRFSFGTRFVGYLISVAVANINLNWGFRTNFPIK